MVDLKDCQQWEMEGNFTHAWHRWNACSHLWKFTTWRFTCRRFTIRVQCCYLEGSFCSVSKFDGRSECINCRSLALHFWCHIHLICSFPFHLRTFGLKSNALNILAIAKWPDSFSRRSIFKGYWWSLLIKFYPNIRIFSLICEIKNFNGISTHLAFLFLRNRYYFLKYMGVMLVFFTNA